ncbi:helix-turn-helix domain-containing protein [Streptomyces sp. NPDC060194]|uniref:helix-turn-helix domain-containing protein n=1 Tax=Streptomyces sp. NPDC060194 TaxID=3347069 RepID=UPI00364FCB71
MNTDDFATADEAAELLGVERRSVYTYVRRLKGFPQPKKVGRTLLFDRRALHDWRAAHPKRRRSAPDAPASGGGVVDAGPPGGEPTSPAPLRRNPDSPPA